MGADTYFDTPERISKDQAAQLGATATAAPGVIALLEGFPTPALLLAPTRQIVALNRRALMLFGSTQPDESIGKRLGEAVGCIHSADMEAGCGTSKACRECGQAKAIRFTREHDQAEVSECRITTERDGQSLSLDLRVFSSPVGLDENLTLVALEDIAHEKRRSALERVFFHDVSNTALAVNGIAQIMTGVNDPERSRELSAALSKSTVQLIDEIQAQRDLLSAENGELAVALDTTSARKIVETVAAIYAASPLAEGRRLTADGPDPDVMVETDLVHAVRSLGNLVKNALEAASPGEEVRVWTEVVPSGLAFHVSNPEVMPEGARLQIFQRSFSSKPGKGRGIGTYSVKLIVEQYLRGEVWFISKPSSGTVFSMRLPRPSAERREVQDDFGAMLFATGLVSKSDVSVAREHAARENIPLVDAVVGLGVVSELDAYRTLARAAHLPFVDLEDRTLTWAPTKLIPERVARRHLVVALYEDGPTLAYAVPRPYDDDADRDIAFVSGRRTHRIIASPHQIVQALDRLYPKRDDFDELLDRVRREAPGRAREWSISSSTASPVIDLCNRLLTRAVTVHASDIHMEPAEGAFGVRYRVGGLLEQGFQLPMEAAPAVTNRLKIMAHIDIFVRTRPQDGAFRATIENRDVDVRMSTLPTIYGEKVVLRIIDVQLEMSRIDELGYDAENVNRLKRVLARPNGLVLVTGPTGCGKTTVLYAALNQLRTGRTNIVTVEDPVERRIEGVNQIPVNNRGGATFAAVLRSVLRQDPNVIMVGEIRDTEVAQIVGQAAYTGHLVLSTVHANDAAAAITRLLNLGLEPFKIAESLAAIVAQRLVRRLCPECRVILAADEATRVAETYGVPHVVAAPGPGCARCKQTGYVDRVPIVEVFVPDSAAVAAIAQGATAAQVRAAMKTAGFRTMRDSALGLIAEGVTSIEEMNRVLVEEMPAAQPVAAAGRRRVLVADDDTMVRMLVKMLLEQEGYEVLEAEDGRRGLEIVRTSRPDLALVDLSMPEVDGYEMIAALRADATLSSLAIMALTAEKSPASQQRVFDLGADDYLIKPFDRELLSARVRALFRRLERR